MAITHVQKIGSITLATGGASSTITIPAGGVAAGEAIIIAVSTGASTVAPSAIDTAGNTYVLRTPPGVVTETGGDSTSILDALNCKALVSGNTITVTFGTGNTEAFAIAEDFSGVGTAADGGAGAGNTLAASLASGNVNTTNANDLLFACCGAQGSASVTWTGGVAGLNVVANGQDSLSTAWEAVSATATYNMTASGSASTSFMTLLTAYKAAGTAAVVSPTFVPGRMPLGA